MKPMLLKRKPRISDRTIKKIGRPLKLIEKIENRFRRIATASMTMALYPFKSKEPQDMTAMATI